LRRCGMESLTSTVTVGAQSELQRIRARYDRRKTLRLDARDSPLARHAFAWAEEKRRLLVRWINTSAIAPVEDKRVLEIGSGDGGDLLDLIRLGFQPENLVANELLDDRRASARRRLPAGVSVKL